MLFPLIVTATEKKCQQTFNDKPDFAITKKLIDTAHTSAGLLKNRARVETGDSIMVNNFN